MKPCRTDKSLRCLSLLLGFIVAALCGCSALQRTQMPLRPEMVPAGYELISVPFYPQTDYQCGPATLAMALTYHGLSITPEELQSQVYDHDHPLERELLSRPEGENAFPYGVGRLPFNRLP